MQVYSNSNPHSNKTILWILVFTCIAFLPVTTFLFHIKNDAFTGYFPPKYYMSECIRNGYLPLWNPYINFGIPQYADMSSAYWNPITWLFACIGYNAYTLTLEIILYLCIAAVGMYKLATSFNWLKEVAVISAMAYCSCGFMVAHLQHFNWIAGAAFLPLCMFHYKKLMDSFSFYQLTVSTISFYFFITAAHPGLIIGAIYYFSALALVTLWKSKERKITIVKSNLLLLLFVGCIATGMIIAYMDVLPFFTRSEKPASDLLKDAGTLPSYISFLLPLSTVKEHAFFATDLTMRNLYFSLLLFVFFIAGLTGKKNKVQWFLLISAIFFLFITADNIFSSTIYRFLPAIGYVRLKAEYHIFTILSAILFSSFFLQNYFTNKTARQKVNVVLHFIIYLLFTTIVFSFYKIAKGNSFIYKPFTSLSSPAAIKNFLDNLTIYDCLLFQSCVQVTVLFFLKRYLPSSRKIVVMIVGFELIIASLSHLPFTSVGQHSVFAVQKAINSAPKGFKPPPLQPIFYNTKGTTEQTNLLGNWSFYNKLPGVVEQAPYPVELYSTKNIFKDSLSDNFNKPIFYLMSGGNIKLESYVPNCVKITVFSLKLDTLVWQQPYYPHWLAYNEKEKYSISDYQNKFTAIPVREGFQKIIFYFNPQKIIGGLLFTLFLLMAGFIYLVLGRKKNYFN